MLIDELEFGVIVLFLSAVWTVILTAPQTAVDPLCIGEFIQICSDKETNSSTSWVAWPGVNIQQIFNFGWTIP